MEKIQENWQIIILILLILGCGAAFYMKKGHAIVPHIHGPDTKEAPWQAHQWNPGPPPNFDSVPK